MAGITLAQAQEMLDAYLAAEVALLTGGQEYSIKDRTFKRGDLATVQAGVERWENKVKELSGNLKGRVRAFTPIG
jgi:hypothetical protein